MKQALEDILSEHRMMIEAGGGGDFVEALAEQPLACIRGTVNPDGTIASGSGFTVTRVSDGHYIITYDTPFDDFPGIGLTPDNFLFVDWQGSPGLLEVFFIQPFGEGTEDSFFTFVIVGPVGGVPNGNGQPPPPQPTAPIGQ